MPPRLNKRQQREQDELAALQAARPAPASDDDEPDRAHDDDEEENEGIEEQSAPKPAVKSMFSALNDNDEAVDDEDDEEQEEETVTKSSKKSKSKKKKKKSKGGGGGDVPPSASNDAPPLSPISLTPSKKTKSSSSNTPTKPDDGGMDEIDRALAELSAKAGGADDGAQLIRGPPVKLEPKWQAVKDAFAFDPKFLDADAELRRMFGSKVINTTTTAPRSGHHARFANNPHHVTSLRRTPSYLASPEAGWLPPGGVLSVARYHGPESTLGDGEWWTYEHNQPYREAQLGFLEVLQQADGNRLYNVLEGHPYHVDTLMQLSEMMVQQGDLGASSTHLSKALYALSAPLPPSFPSGLFRMPYSQIENRAFFLGVARKVSILVKRGTWRTACEWSKIALGVGGEADPVGMLVFIDFLAPKAKQNKWFLATLEALHTAYPQMRIGSYPGLAFAKALCIRGLEEENSEDDTKSTAALQSAILRFPMIPSLLFTSLGGNPPPKLVTHRRAQVDGAFSDKPSYLLSLLSELYVARSSPLWKEPPVLAWLQKTVNTAAPLLDSSANEDVRIGEKLWGEGPWPAGFAPSGVVRAAYISEIASVRPYLPPSALSGTSYSYDPIPPSRDQATFYDDTYFAPLYSHNPARRGGGRSRPRQARPAAGTIEMMRRQLEDLFARGEIDPTLRDVLVAELMEGAQGGNAGLPGGFPGAEEEEDEEDDDDEDDGQGEAEGQQERNDGFLARLAGVFGVGAVRPPPPEDLD